MLVGGRDDDGRRELFTDRELLDELAAVRDQVVEAP
jgi:hypothetical protein